MVPGSGGAEAITGKLCALEVPGTPPLEVPGTPLEGLKGFYFKREYDRDISRMGLLRIGGMRAC